MNYLNPTGSLERKKKGQKTIADPYCGLGMAEAKVLSVLQKNTSKMLIKKPT